MRSSLLSFAIVVLAATSARAQPIEPASDPSVAVPAAVTPEEAPVVVDQGAEPICPCRAAEALLDSGAAKFKSGDFELELHGRLNVWGGWLGADSRMSEGDKMDQPGFRLRRARLGVEGQILQPLTYKIEMDLFDKSMSGGPLYQAWVDFTPIQYIGLKVGFMEFPLVRGMDAGSFGLAHIDRAVGIYAMSPTNSLGAVLHSEPWKDHLVISFGVFNGLERGDSFFAGYAPVGISEGNRFEKLAYVGRVDVVPLGKLGTGEADVKQEQSFCLGFGGGILYSDGTSVSTLAGAAWLHMKAWGFHLNGDFVMDRSKPKSDAGQAPQLADLTRRMAVQGSVGYVFLKDLLGIAARIEYIDSNMDALNEGDQIIAAGTLSYYAIGNWVKVQLEYQHRQELHGLSLGNDHVIAGVQAAF